MVMSHSEPNNIWLTVLAVLLAGILVVVAFNAGSNSNPQTISILTSPDAQVKTLSASGTVTKMVAPDKVDIVLSVETLDKSAQKSQSDNAVIADKVKTVLESLSSVRVEVKTVSYSVNEDFEWNDLTRKSESIGYRTVNQIQVTLKGTDITRAGTIIDLAVGAGANRVSGITFGLTDAKELEVRKLALGEAIVSGQITPDSYVVEKTPRRIIDTNVSEQERGLFKIGDKGGNEWQNITKERGNQQKLNEKQIMELSEIILRIEKHYGFPCDIEWAFEEGKFFIVQSRPITTLTDTTNDAKMPLVEEEPKEKVKKKDRARKESKKKVDEKKLVTSEPLKNFDDVLSFVKKTSLDIKQARCSVPIAELVFKPYVQKDVLGGLYSPIIIPFKEGNLQQVIVQEQMDGVERNIWKIAIGDKKKFAKILAGGVKLQKRIDSKSILFEELSSLNDKKFYDYYNEILSLSLEWWKYSKIGEDKGLIVEEIIAPLLIKNHSLTREKAIEIISDVSMPKGQSIFTKERLMFLELSLLVIKDKKLFSLIKEGKPISSNHKKFLTKIKEYSKKYFYSRTNFYEAVKINPFTLPNIILNEIQKTSPEKIMEEYEHIKVGEKELHKRQSQWSKQIKFTPEEKEYLWYFTIMHSWIDDRKVCMMKHFYYLLNIFEELGRRKNIPYKTIVLMTHEEIETLFLSNKMPNENISERQKGVVFVYQNKWPRFEILGKEAQELMSQINSQNYSEVITGTVASKGKAGAITGNVRIIHDPAKDTFLQGEILVTTMTRPEFVPIMKKALAIVTDEGGLTCHAAIVSRELGIPCIIGTKNATRLIKDGDLVEVNADIGVVRKLS